MTQPDELVPGRAWNDSDFGPISVLAAKPQEDWENDLYGQTASPFEMIFDSLFEGLVTGIAFPVALAKWIIQQFFGWVPGANLMVDILDEFEDFLTGIASEGVSGIPILGPLFDIAGTFFGSFIPGLDASKIVSGSFAMDFVTGLVDAIEGLLPWNWFTGKTTAGSNLIVSPDFEDTAIARADTVTGLPRTTGYSTEQARSGTHSWKTTTTGQWDGLWLNKLRNPEDGFRVQPGQKFYVEAWLFPKATNTPGSAYRLNAHCVNSATNATTYPWIGDGVTNPTLGQWVKLSGYITVPADCDLLFIAPLSYETNPVGNVFYLDDVLVREETASQNIIETLFGVVGDIVGTIFGSFIPGLDSSKIISGTFPQSMITGLVDALGGIITDFQSLIDGIIGGNGNPVTSLINWGINTVLSIFSPLRAANLYGPISTTAVTLVNTGSVAAVQDNFLVNATFETADSVAAEANWSWDDQLAHNGYGCGKVVANGTDNMMVSNEIRVTEGETVEVAAWVKWDKNVTITEPFNNLDAWTKHGDDVNQISIDNGTLRIDHTATPQSNYVLQDDPFDLTGAYAKVKIADFGNTSYGSHDVILRPTDGTNNDFSIVAEDSYLYFQKCSGGNRVNLSWIDLNTTDHRWWRIRESGGTVYFETSPDDVTWTIRETCAATWDITTMWTVLYVGNWQTEAGGSYAKFDDFSVGQIFEYRPNLVVNNSYSDTTYDPPISGGALSTEQAHSGQRSYKITAPGSPGANLVFVGDSWGPPSLHCSPGDEFTIDCWVYRHSNNTDTGNIIIWTGLYSSVTDDWDWWGWPGWAQSTLTKGVWTQKTASFTIPEGRDAAIFGIQVGDTVSAGDIFYFDDSSVYKMETDPIALGVTKYQVTYANGQRTRTDLGVTPLASLVTPAASGDWTELTGTYTVEADVDELRLTFGIGANLSSGTVYFDDCTLKKVDLIGDHLVPGVGTTVDNTVQALYGWTGDGFSHDAAYQAMLATSAATTANAQQIQWILQQMAAQGDPEAVIAVDDFKRVEFYALTGWNLDDEEGSGAGYPYVDGENLGWYPSGEVGRGLHYRWVGNGATSGTDYQKVSIVLASAADNLHYHHKGYWFGIWPFAVWIEPVDEYDAGYNYVHGRMDAYGLNRISGWVAGDGTVGIDRVLNGVSTTLETDTLSYAPGAGASVSLICGDKDSETPRYYELLINNQTVLVAEGDTTSNYGTSYRNWGLGLWAGGSNNLNRQAVPALVNSWFGQDQ